MSSKRGIALALIGAAVLGSTAHAQDAGWMIRARALLVAPNAKSTPAGLDVKADAVAEVDITRYLNKNFALELVLGTATQEVTAKATNGTVTSLGSASHLPPTLVLQFHPVATGPARPYLGLGGNMTIFYAKSGGLDALKLSTSLGWAAQGGIDFKITDKAFFNVDFKYVAIKTDVKSGSTKAYELKINPLLIGVGFGHRF